MNSWANDAIFYHIYPLGLCGAPHRNPFSGPVQSRLEKISPWFDQAWRIGANAVLLGPVMESTSHGYDVVDYLTVDRRLGDQSLLKQVIDDAHSRGMKVVFDGVFNHVGRDFPGFLDLREKGRESAYADWFYVDFAGMNAFHDPFSYVSWNGCFDLVKLNLSNAKVRGYLFKAVAEWIEAYGIDGLRIDAADHIGVPFIADLGNWCRSKKGDFWVMGEVVKGPYNRWLMDGQMDSVTNYECYKALYSSHNDHNYYELAYCLRDQAKRYGDRAKDLFAFADNHDVDRVSTRLRDRAHLYSLYCLLFTIPGVPAVYYGSEFGVKGAKSPADDWSLRPAFDLEALRNSPHLVDPVRAIAGLAKLRSETAALRFGDYEEVFLGPRRFVFSRRTVDQWVVVAVSAEKRAVEQTIALPGKISGRLVDLLNGGEEFTVKNGEARIAPLWPCWARVLEVRQEG